MMRILFYFVSTHSLVCIVDENVGQSIGIDLFMTVSGMFHLVSLGPWCGDWV